MKKEIIVALALLLSTQLSAQTSLRLALESVEANNPQLQARRELTNAQSLEARVGNSLENPTVSYDYLWGAPSNIGENSEFNITQAFELPMAYVYKNRAAKARAAQYGYEYAEFRQQLLLQAQMAYIECVALQESYDVAASQLNQVEKLSEAVNKRFVAGDATIIEKNRADIEFANSKNEADLLKVQLRGAQSRLGALNGGVAIDVSGVALDDLAVGCDSIAPQAKMEELYATASPRLLLAISQVRVAEQDIKVSRSGSLPKIELGYRRESAVGEKFNGVTMGVSVPMFGNRNNVKRAKAGHRYAEMSLQSEQTEVRILLTELYEKLEILRGALSAYRSSDNSGNTAYLLDRALSAGQISVPDYISEIAVVNTIRQTKIDLQREFLNVCSQIRSIEL